VAQLYPRVLGSLSVASYDSQGYGGGILTRLHTGVETTLPFFTVTYRKLVLNAIFARVFDMV
jgi:hypothetical protein